MDDIASITTGPWSPLSRPRSTHLEGYVKLRQTKLWWCTKGIENPFTFWLTAYKESNFTIPGSFTLIVLKMFWDRETSEQYGKLLLRKLITKHWGMAWGTKSGCALDKFAQDKKTFLEPQLMEAKMMLGKKLTWDLRGSNLQKRNLIKKCPKSCINGLL